MPDARKRNVVIIGGSYAGMSVAHYLLKNVQSRLPDAFSYQVVLISASNQVLCRPACPRAMISDEFFDQSKLFVDIEAHFKQYPADSFKFIEGTATVWNHQGRRVTVRSEKSEIFELDYDALVIATGSSTFSPLLGLTGDASQLRDSWKDFRGALKSAKTILIAGGGPAGVETAGELGEYLNGRASGWFGGGSKPSKVTIKLVTSASQILPALRPSIAAKAESYLAQVGVEVVKNTKVTQVQPQSAGTSSVTSPATITLENGQQVQADIYIPATGTSPNTSFVDPKLLTDDRRISNNAATLRIDAVGPRVYAIGDAASAAQPAIHQIFEQVPVLCANLKRDLLLAAGQDESTVGHDRIFKEDTRETQMVLIGESVGVGAAMGWALPSWAVKMIKRDYWLWTTGALWSGAQWKKEK